MRGRGVGIFLGSGVQATKVDAEPKQTIFFSHQHYGVAPWGLGGSDRAAIQHLLDVLAHFVYQGWGNSAEPFFEQFVLHQLNDMLGGIRAPYLIWL